MSTQQQPQPSLYERLGGIYNIATVVDDFIDRVMTDPRLNANPAVNEAHHRVPPAGFKYLVTEMVGMATGGPQKYTGRSMVDSHRGHGFDGCRATRQTGQDLPSARRFHFVGFRTAYEDPAAALGVAGAAGIVRSAHGDVLDGQPVGTLPSSQVFDLGGLG